MAQPAADARFPVWALIAITALSLLLRVYRLGAQCFWYDEAQTLYVARFPLDQIIQHAYRPPLYHFLLHAWSTLVPDSEFWLRLPSALFGALVPPLIAILGVRLYGRRTGLVAGLLAAISPALVAYSQELRMYSLLALEYVVLGCLAVALLRDERIPLWKSVGYGLTATAALYTHYFAAPFVLGLGAMGLVILVLNRRRARLWHWIGIHTFSGLAFLPWLGVVLSGRGGTEDFVQAEVSPILTEVPGVGAFVTRVWLFYTTGPTTSDSALVHIWAAGAGIAFLVATLCLALAGLIRASRRSADGTADASSLVDLILIGVIALPLLVAGSMYGLRPGTVHPRHLMMIAVPFALLVARIACRAWGALSPCLSRKALRARHAGAVLWTAGFAGLFALSLVLYTSEPALQRADVRLLADRIEAETSSGDVVLLPYQDYAFGYYYEGPAADLFLETRVGDKDLLNWLMPQMQQARRAVVLRWVHTLSDPRDAIDWFLEANGRLEERYWLAERWVNVYALDEHISLPELAPSSITFGPLALSGVWIPDAQPADEALPVALRWTLSEPVPADLKASVRLIDAAGRVIVADDRVILGERTGAGTSQWQAGEQAYNYYLLDIPAGTPPVDYDIAVTVYRDTGPLLASQEGKTLGSMPVLGETMLLAPAEMSTNLPAEAAVTVLERDLGAGLIVAAVGPLPATVEAAEPLSVTLYWKASRALQALEPSVVLVERTGSSPGGSGWYPGVRALSHEPLAHRPTGHRTSRAAHKPCRRAGHRHAVCRSGWSPGDARTDRDNAK